MTKFKDPNSWGYGGVRRRDFRASREEPEVPHHYKGSKRKIKDRTKCVHEWGEWDDHYKWNTRAQETVNEEGHILQTWRSYLYQHRICKACRKRESKYLSFEHKRWLDSNRRPMSESKVRTHPRSY